jgi:hypothetical protein
MEREPEGTGSQGLPRQRLGKRLCRAGRAGRIAEEAAMIELTPEQRRAAEQGEAVRVVDPTTHDAYVFVRAEVFEQLTGVLPTLTHEPPPDIDPLTLRSMQAFWRELPELLK